MQYRDEDTTTRERSRNSDHWSNSRGGNGAFFGDRDQSSSNRRSYGYDRDYDGRRENQDQFGRSGQRSDDLIASDRVEGTAVYGRKGNKLGSIHNFMVEKRGGRVAYAVMKRSSGFLDMDERYYPLNWSELDYDPQRDGYCVNMTEDDLEDRRSFDSRGRPVNDGYENRDGRDRSRYSNS